MVDEDWLSVHLDFHAMCFVCTLWAREYTRPPSRHAWWNTTW